MQRLKAILAFLSLYVCITSLGVAVLWLYLHGTPPSPFAPLGIGAMVAVWTLPVMVFIATFMGNNLVSLAQWVRGR